MDSHMELTMGRGAIRYSIMILRIGDRDSASVDEYSNGGSHNFYGV